MGGGGAIPLNKYRSFTLVGLRDMEMALQAAFRTGSIFEACVDLLQTGDAYSAEEKHTAGAMVRVDLTRFNKIATQGAPQMAVDKEANSLSRVYSYYSKFNLCLFYV